MDPSFGFERIWGSQHLTDRQSRFRLWAPGQERLWLYAEASGARLPMARQEDGWFELVTDAVPADTGYMFELGDGMRVPDPAARAQMGDVHGPSRLVDPRAYRWRVPDWRGRPWHEAVIYELHTGTFSPEGTFEGVERRLDHLADIGITAVELMPVAQFSGQRGWGYDGVLLYAPHVAYGEPEKLKSLVDAAHERGLMILLDVVYNHFGPDGNYLSLYAPDFFDPERKTPWGPAIDYTQDPVRRFAIENALYWLEEYRFDGLRLDAIDHIDDPSSPSVLEELAMEVRARITDRHVHLTTEDSRNITGLHERDEEGRPRLYTAEWNDDVHHVAHVLATSEDDGYYIDYQSGPAGMLGRALASGYVYQGEASPYFEEPRGMPSGDLPPVAFVDFLQNHDQIGNRAFGDRLTTLSPPEAVDALTAVLLLSPHIPLLYMGEEWGETRPFLFFTDFHGELGDAVREGRRSEFGKWRTFQDPAFREKIPDPNAEETFQASKLNWSALGEDGREQRLALVKRLLALRQAELMPRLAQMGGNCVARQIVEGAAIHLAWAYGGGEYAMTANLSPEPLALPGAIADALDARARPIFELPVGAGEALKSGRLGAWSVMFTISETSNI